MFDLSRTSIPRALAIPIAAALPLLISLVLASPVQAGPPIVTIDGDYCINGNGDGTPWWWRVIDLTSATPAVIGSNTSDVLGLSVTGTTLQVATAFKDSIKANTVSPFLMATAVLGDPPCGAAEAKLDLMFLGGTVWTLEVGNSASGPWATVGSLAVAFNPTIRQVPEPGAGALLAAGVAAVAILKRFGRRTRS